MARHSIRLERRGVAVSAPGKVIFRVDMAATGYGDFFDTRQLDPTGGTGDGTYDLLTGKQWLSSDDDANVGNVDGAPDVAKLYYPNGLTLCPDGLLRVTSFGFESPGNLPDLASGCTLRTIHPTTGNVTTIHGPSGESGNPTGHAYPVDGLPGTGTLRGPASMVPTNTGIFIADYYGGLRFCDYETNTLTTVIPFDDEPGDSLDGTAGEGATATSKYCNGLTFLPGTRKLIMIEWAGAEPREADAYWGKIRQLDLYTMEVTTLAVSASVSSAFDCAMALASDAGTLWLFGFVAGTIKEWDMTETPPVTRASGLFLPNGATLGNDGVIYYCQQTGSDSVWEILDHSPYTKRKLFDAPAGSATFPITFDGTNIYFTGSYNPQVFKGLPTA